VLGIGLESGIFPVPSTNQKYFNISTCAIYDGTDFAIGMGPAFELPKIITDTLRADPSTELAEVFDTTLAKKGILHDKSGGAIGYLTRYHTDRKAHLKYSLLMALQQFINSDLYKET
jgi:non-canonical (house-cleaning) NTP pyrophosphatase